VGPEQVVQPFEGRGALGQVPPAVLELHPSRAPGVLDQLGHVERVALGQPMDPRVGLGMAGRTEDVVDEELDLVLGERLQVDAVDVPLPPEAHDRVRCRLVRAERQEEGRHGRRGDGEDERGGGVVEQVGIVDEHRGGRSQRSGP
jgi:hypothetical protein